MWDDGNAAFNFAFLTGLRDTEARKQVSRRLELFNFQIFTFCRHYKRIEPPSAVVLRLYNGVAWSGREPEVNAEIGAGTKTFEHQAKFCLQKITDEALEIERREDLKIIMAHQDCTPMTASLVPSGDRSVTQVIAKGQLTGSSLALPEKCPISAYKFEET